MATVDLSKLIEEGNPADPQADPQQAGTRAVAQPGGGRLTSVPPPPDQEADAAALVAAVQIPQPHPPLADGPLTEDEAAELRLCEEAIRSQQLAFAWGVGQALSVISEGRLYRASHARFESYVADQWDLSPARAYQLIATWPIARKLAVSAIVDTRRVNEGQLRALTPVVRAHGLDAAVMVYETVTETAAEVDGAKVTARILKDVTERLPADHLDRSLVAERTRAYLTEPRVPRGRVWDSTRDNAVKALRQVAESHAHPAEVLEAITELRTLLDQIEAALKTHHVSEADLTDRAPQGLGGAGA
jgi:hypothetical protein